MPIKKIPATISAVRTLTDTAREVELTLKEPLTFTAGQFVNLFLPRDGAIARRAYSITSHDGTSDRITLSIRLTPDGLVTPFFFGDTCMGSDVEIMGPLGINTADKMTKDKTFLFGFGIGAGVTRSVAMHVIEHSTMKALTIMTGSRNENDIIHKDFYDTLATHDPRVHLSYVVSNPTTELPYLHGYIQDHIAHIDFSHADVYICGQTVACTALVEAIRNTNPEDCTFLIESFG